MRLSSGPLGGSLGGPPNWRSGSRIPLAGALICAMALLAGCGSSDHPSATTSAAPSQSTALVAIGAGLRGPAGLAASVYAQGPATVAAMAFDPAGRLWLTAAGLEGHPRDGVYLIAHPGAPAQKIVSGLDDPLGLLWFANKLYVASVGRVDAYGGFTGTRFRTHTEILRGPVAHGENNLLALAPDGRFMMGVTATCDHCTPTSPWSGAIVSFKPDGHDLRLYASRIRAPFGLAYFPGTADLLVTMNQRDDLGAATPGDWLAQVREGQNWGFPQCYGQGGAACVGVPKPIAVFDKHAAVGGIAITTGQLGPAVGTSAVVAEWQTAKVQRVALTRTAAASTAQSSATYRSSAQSSATYSGTVTPFLTGLHNPLAVALAPGGGALLVADWATGTIYRIARASS